MKKATLSCIFLLFLKSTIISAQSNNLFFNSLNSVINMNFSEDDPVISSTGITGGYIGEGIAHIEDDQGDLLFYVNTTGVFRADNTLMPGSETIYANDSAAEINICKVPGDPNRYYIIHNVETCSPLYYTIVDMSLEGGLGGIEEMNNLFSMAEYGEGIELIRKPGTENFWMLIYECNEGIIRFFIDEDGISEPEMIQAHVPIEDGYDGRSELEYHNGKIAMGFCWSNESFVADFDAETGELTDLIVIPNVDAYGVEFSSDGSKIYFSKWYELEEDNLFQYNISTGVVTPYFLQMTDCSDVGGVGSNSSNGFGQIEQGADGDLYIIQDRGCGITKISNANTTNPIFDVVVVPNELALGISDPNWASPLYPLSVHAILVDDCDRSGVGSIDLEISGGFPPYNCEWVSGETVTSLDNLLEGIYTVTITDSNAGIITQSYELVDDPVYTPEITLEDDVLYSNYQVNNQWYFEGEPIDGATETSLAVSESGSYGLQIMHGDCSSEIVMIAYVNNVSLAEYDISDQVQIFPNPTTGKLRIKLPKDEQVNVYLYALQGKKIMEWKNISHKDQLDLSAIERGLYFLRIETPYGKAVKPLHLM